MIEGIIKMKVVLIVVPTFPNRFNLSCKDLELALGPFMILSK